MQLNNDQVTTEEVKSWKGLHLLHFQGSSCSQKVRILLRKKKIKYKSHPDNIMKDEHISAWYLGINPRGVVPVLVHDGIVHIESNDILEYLDALPSKAQPFFPQNQEQREAVKASLDLEDSLHVDLRNLTMGFMAPRKFVEKSPETLERYEKEGADDPKRAQEIAWWRDFARQGIPEDKARQSIAKYRAAFDTLGQQLQNSEWLMGDHLSVLDIAWFISTNRLEMAGYPLEWHPKLLTWHKRLQARSSFSRETNMGFMLTRVVGPLYRTYRALRRTTMKDMVS